MPHFNRDTVELASSRERDESNPGINTLLPFLKKTLLKRAIVALDACYWLHKAISISLSLFGDDRRCPVSGSCATWLRRYLVTHTAWFVCMYVFHRIWLDLDLTLIMFVPRNRGYYVCSLSIEKEKKIKHEEHSRKT